MSIYDLWNASINWKMSIYRVTNLAQLLKSACTSIIFLEAFSKKNISISFVSCE